MAWNHSLIENPHLAEEFLYKALDDTHGRCAPWLKQEVQAKKGKVETARRLVTALTTSSDWDRITRKGIVQTICGRMLSLIPIEGTKGLAGQKLGSVQKMVDYQKFAEVAAGDASARYKVLIEVVMFRCGYQAPDLVEKAFRNHPTLRTAAQIGTPIVLKIVKGVASAGIGVGTDAAGGAGMSALGDALGGVDTVVGGLIDTVSSDAERISGAVGQAASGKGKVSTLPLASSQAAHGHRAVICEFEDPHIQDSLGVSGMAVRHRIAVFQVTPLRYTTVEGSSTRMISAFKKSVLGIRTFKDAASGRGGVETGVAALNYARLYDHAEKQPFLASMGIVDSAGMSSWMENPTYFLRDATISTAAQAERLGTNPGANIFHGDYEQWKSSAAVRATR